MARPARKCQPGRVLLLPALLLAHAVSADVGSPEDVAVVARAVEVSDRVVAGGAAAIGGAAGGFVGGAVAVGLSAALSGFDDRAALLPLLLLPPAVAGTGAYVVGRAVADANVGLAGGAGAAGLCTVWSVVLGVLLVSDEDRLLGNPGATFAATAIVPAAAALIGAAAAAPWAAPPLE